LLRTPADLGGITCSDNGGEHGKTRCLGDGRYAGARGEAGAGAVAVDGGGGRSSDRGAGSGVMGSNNLVISLEDDSSDPELINICVFCSNDVFGADDGFAVNPFHPGCRQKCAMHKKCVAKYLIKTACKFICTVPPHQ
jgi:hypothetical protein